MNELTHYVYSTDDWALLRKVEQENLCINIHELKAWMELNSIDFHQITNWRKEA